MSPQQTLYLFGFDNQFKELCDIYLNKKLPNKLLFSGKKGIGKCVFAYHFINFILSQNEDNKYNLENFCISPTNRSYKLINVNLHPNFYLLKKKDDKKLIEISQIRELNKFINNSSFNNHLKIVLIDDVETLSINASNSLLKLIEEPNNNVQYFLIYDNSKYILDTIRSRCIDFNFHLKEENYSKIINFYFNKDRIYENINSDFKYSYLTPLNFINLINFSVSEETNISELTINNLIKIIIDKNLYKKNHLIQNEIKILLEIFFYKKYKYSKSNKLYKMINYFNKKYSEAIKFNIDLEPIFLEIKTELLNEK